MADVTFKNRVGIRAATPCDAIRAGNARGMANASTVRDNPCVAKTCFIVDHCPAYPLDIESALSGGGFQCDACRTGIDPQNCDLVLVHVEASDPASHATIRDLSAQKQDAKIVVVYEGGHKALPELFDSLAKTQGADRVLPGPVSPARLSKTLAELGLSE